MALSFTNNNRRARKFFFDNKTGNQYINGTATNDQTNSDNIVRTVGSSSGGGVSVRAAGQDTNIKLTLSPKGSGDLEFLGTGKFVLNNSSYTGNIQLVDDDILVNPGTNGGDLTFGGGAFTFAAGTYNTSLTVATATANRTITFPDATGTAVLADATQTLTNKTLGATSASGNITPTVDNTYDLGSTSYRWRDVYIGPGSLYVNNKQVLSDESGTITVQTSDNQNLTVKTTGTGVTTVSSATQVALTATSSGDITLTTSSGNIELKGTVEVLTGKKITDSAGSQVAFGNSIYLDNGSNLIFEGGTDDTYETTIQVADPTADRTITLPDATGTVALTSDIPTAVSELTNDSGYSTTTGTVTSVAGTGTVNGISLSGTVTSSGSLTLGGTFSATVSEISDLTATAAELNTLDGITATVTELNYTDGVTSAIQTQLDAKLASASYTASDVLTKIKTVDGAGSGLDADLLDGISSASFLRSDATTTFNANGNDFNFNSDGSRTLINFQHNGTTKWQLLQNNSGNDLNFNYLTGGGQFEVSGNTVWHAGNDGTGSGLDADLLDGNEATAFALLSGATFTGAVSGTSLTLSGDLTVNGTTTTLNTTNTVVSDNLIELNNGVASNANDSGIVIERGSTGDNAFMGWDESADTFILGTTTATGASTGDLTITVAPLETGALGVTGNITVSGTVDGRDVATDGSKLDGIEAGADVTDTANVTAAGALMDSEVDADIKTLSLPANTTISAFGATLVDDADAAAARTTLGVDASGTDNSTDVTLSGTPDYITISGQVITRNAIDLTTDVTGALPVANGGTGSTTDSGARTNLGLVIGTDVQAYDAGLLSIAGLTTASDNMIYTTASDTYAVTSLTSAGRALLDDADAAAQLITLGLTATAAELNYTDGVTSNIQTQLDAKTSYANSDVDAHLNQSNPTSGYVLSWNGTDYAWVSNAGYTNSDVDSHLNQSNPTDGYVLSWTSGDYAWVAQSGGGGGGGYTAQSTAPSSPSAGDEWWDTDNAIFYKYIDDGTNQQWVEWTPGENGTDGTDGADGTGFTGGSYNSSTGVVTFTSNDGLGFSTSDLRGADGGGANLDGTTAISGNILPDTDNTRDLGSASYKFANIYATTFNGVATSSKYADLAEKYIADMAYEPGTVLILGGSKEVTMSEQLCDSRIAGVVSTAPGFIMNSELTQVNTVMIALLGRIPCKVTGTIRKGDLLCSSTTPGVATSVKPQDVVPGSVIGKAMEDYNSDALGVIEIMVGRI